MYISNENATAVDVYFDDITMTYTPTNVIQYNEYYPFGLQTADSWTRANASNNFLYNEGSELNQTSGFYDLPFRNYDASLGRFFQVDPLSYVDNATSPFAYAGNNPVVFNDPQGLMVSAAGLSDYQLRMMYRRDMAGYLSYDDWASQNIIEYAAGKGFDAAGGSGGGMWGSWSKTPIFGLVQGRKPRYETEGNDYWELGIVGYEWSYTPGNGRSPFDQVMGDPATTSGGKPQGNWAGGEGPGDPKKRGAKDTRSGWSKAGHMLLQMFNLEEDDPELWGPRPMKSEMPFLATVFTPTGVIGAYSKLAQMTRGSGGLLQAHHIVEARHLERLGLSLSEAPAVILSREKHLAITNELRRLMPYGNPIRLKRL